MTGLDLLREELIKRGATRQQTESKLVAMTLDVIANTGTENADVWRKEVDETEHLRKTMQEKRWLEKEIVSLQMTLGSLERKKALLLEKFNEVYAYVESFNESLNKCDTPEGRDRMRIAQMYVNTVNIDSKYDNTAFIIGLAAILTGGDVKPMEELKKINKKLFNERF